MFTLINDGASLSEFFAREDYFAKGAIALQPQGLAQDSYTATYETFGYYASATFAVEDVISVNAGARVERALIDSETSGAESSGFEQTNLFPGGSLTYFVNDEMQVRAAVSKTTNRPQLRELVAVQYLDPQSGFFYVGQPELKPATIKNWDLRFEWYPSTLENISVATFLKELDNPIEIVRLPGAETHRDPFKTRKLVLSRASRRTFGLSLNACPNLLWGFTP